MDKKKFNKKKNSNGTGNGKGYKDGKDTFKKSNKWCEVCRKKTHNTIDCRNKVNSDKVAAADSTDSMFNRASGNSEGGR